MESRHLDPQDVENIEDAIFDLHMGLTGNPILNIHILFDQDNDYIGTWITMKDTNHYGSELVWLFFDREWNHFISNEGIMSIFRYLEKNITHTFYYQMYGNFNNWQLIRNGRMTIKRW